MNSEKNTTENFKAEGGMTVTKTDKRRLCKGTDVGFCLFHVDGDDTYRGNASSFCPADSL